MSKSKILAFRTSEWLVTYPPLRHVSLDTIAAAQHSLARVAIEAQRNARGLTGPSAPRLAVVVARGYGHDLATVLVEVIDDGIVG